MPTCVLTNEAVQQHMRHAIRLSLSGMGRTAENPSVGCVLLNPQGQVVAAARTADAGRPHAETRAISQVQAHEKVHTAFVTLEPCAHQGQTGPCAEALIQAGVEEVFLGCQDTDPRVAGRGIAMMQAAGIKVTSGIEQAACRSALRGFFSRIERGRPFISLKIATSLDGKTALANGASKWITGPQARHEVHRQRARADAILVSSKTLLADKARLNVRLSGLEPFSPRCVVLDRRGTLKPSDTAHLRDALTITASDCATMSLPNGEEGFDLNALATLLGEQGINTLYIESGGALATSFLNVGLVDQLIWFRAPKIVGDDAKAAVGALALQALVDAKIFKRIETKVLGSDLMEIYEPCLQD